MAGSSPAMTGRGERGTKLAEPESLPPHGGGFIDRHRRVAPEPPQGALGDAHLRGLEEPGIDCIVGPLAVRRLEVRLGFGRGGARLALGQPRAEIRIVILMKIYGVGVVKDVPR